MKTRLNKRRVREKRTKKQGRKRGKMEEELEDIKKGRW